RVNYLSITSQHIAKASQQKTQLANNELSKTLAKLEKNNRLKDQFLGTISHELRTPMNGVEGSLALIKTDNLNPKQENYIKTAKQSAQEMTSLVDSILRFSEIQSGALEIKREPINLRKILNPLAATFRQLCLKKGLIFSWHIDKSIPEVIESDNEQLLLILNQLIDNAIKFTQKGHVFVNINVGMDEQNQQKLLLISVIDSGEGIQPEQLDTVFNVFQQLDGNFNRNHKGLGIGLAICHQLATIMDGKLLVKSIPGEGTEFIFSLPLILSSTTAPKEPNEQPDLPCKQKTILVAEDNPVNQLVLKGMLQNFDCIILTASNGEEVSTLLNSQPVDLIMMDCQMPIVDGFEATRKIRDSNAVYCNIPIIAVTANAMTSDSVRCLKAGMNDYIKKPINREVVERKVKRWLQHNKMTAV
ncbi:MAG: response regulator, partial [Pseudomonadales bacterium]